MPHRFRPPKKREDEKWNAAQYLVEQGFCYEHISPAAELTKRSEAQANYVPYPENLREAREFVQQYRAFAKKP
ncbi:hypothetical protein GCM10011383_13850 [Hymenobacter cavernae]|uniref:Uncharacterized protein n=1 Tax=Hymenobacter cavernae TaxID=2044852 RepID=A0ABQ1TUZ4_9BACT|nr:hypothetical protein GCM10011383_13850 [Hymenobacter cavernae]